MKTVTSETQLLYTTVQMYSSTMMNQTHNSDCNSRADFQFYLFPVVYTLVMILGLPGNLGALWFFLFKRKQRTASDIYLLNLAVADTAFLCTLPFRIHYHWQHNVWKLGNFACVLSGIGFHANIYASIFFMTCICVDRYVATVYPLTYLRLRNTRCTMLVSSTFWLVYAVALLVFFLTGPPDSEGDSCFENFSQEEWERRLGPYSVLCLVFGSLLPSVVILVCYPLVARRITHIRSSTAGKARRIIYIILAITLVCFLPYHTVHLLHLLRRMKYIQNCAWADAIYKARRITMALVSFNSCLDPVVYYFSTNNCKWSMPRLRWLRPNRTRGIYYISTDL
ncbi:lysophosphatidic acid receptor 6 [Clupea harengus]|uniref:Lysophosphatidic acid receptor 6 n=1 Tax=Clupea harengus TaxID=7950 RepID=A0A6P3WF84_CLUHA|nr:lysophosphatidic acid receptor 6 [Clupea harengus]